MLQRPGQRDEIFRVLRRLVRLRSANVTAGLRGQAEPRTQAQRHAPRGVVHGNGAPQSRRAGEAAEVTTWEILYGRGRASKRSFRRPGNRCKSAQYVGNASRDGLEHTLRTRDIQSHVRGARTTYFAQQFGGQRREEVHGTERADALHPGRRRVRRQSTERAGKARQKKFQHNARGVQVPWCDADAA